MAGVKGKSGGKRAGSGRPKKEDRSLDKLTPPPEEESKAFDDPLIFLKTAMNDPKADAKIRVDAAKALMPYIHIKKGEAGGKKEERAAAADKAGFGKFKPGRAPGKLVSIK